MKVDISVWIFSRLAILGERFGAGPGDLFQIPTNLRHGCPAASATSRLWDKRPMQWRRLGGFVSERKSWITRQIWVVVSNMFYVHPDPCKNDPIWRVCIFFKGLVVETTNYRNCSDLTMTSRQICGLVREISYFFDGAILWFGQIPVSSDQNPGDLLFFF